MEEKAGRGARCTAGYRLRMRRASEYATADGCGWFTTTLSISPHKDAQVLNPIGKALS